MNSNAQLINEIIGLEYNMFFRVNNINGRASCQDDFETFNIMRSSQFSAWSEDTLKSYLYDLKEAVSEERNLVAEKYAWMMEETHPAEFAIIQGGLPKLSERVLKLVNEICNLQQGMTKELYEKFPKTMSGARPMDKNSADSLTSNFTYMAGELKTYSCRTLEFYLAHLKKCREEGVNFPYLILDATAKHYGYTSLEEREASL